MGSTRRGAVVGVAVAVMLFVAAPVALAGKPANQPTVQFKQGGYGVKENVSPAQIAIERAPKGSSTVHFGTAGGTATAGASCSSGVDYVAVADALVTFSDQALLTTPVTICNDALDEAPETVVLQLFGPSSGTSLGSKRQATLTINDDDPTPSLSVLDSSVDEGDLTDVMVLLSAPSGQPVSFSWATADGTATTGDGDYDAHAGSVTLEAGQLGVGLRFRITDDATDEPDETLTVSIGSPVNATVTDGSGTVTIVDNDDPAPDTTAPTSLSATIADNDGDHEYSVGDVVTLVFDEPMNTASVDSGEGIFYRSTGEFTEAVTEGTYSFVNATTLQITIDATSSCTTPTDCALGGDITFVTPDTIEDVGGNDWALAGDVTLEDPNPPDVTAPSSTSATIADNDSDHALSVGDVITIRFDEAMNTSLVFPRIYYNGTERIDAGTEAALVWLDSSTMRLTIQSLSVCPATGCELGHDLTSLVDADSIEDIAGNDWALAGDVTLEDPHP